MPKHTEPSEQQDHEQLSQRIGPDDEWMTLKDATAYTKIKRGTLYQLMKEKILPWYRVTGTSQRRFKRSDLDKLMIPGDAEDNAADNRTDT